MTNDSLPPMRWYQGITRYQWLVLLLASAGWVFDVFEGQIYGLTRDRMLGELFPPSAEKEADIRFYGEVIYGVFLAGGAFGGILFGSLADRWGRRPMLVATILIYSLFSGLTYFVTSASELTILRFLVAIGVGGEWSVAASLVAEEFPPRSRAQVGGIFHASSILGTWTAGLVAMTVGTQWRYAYLVGVLPALLVVWIRLQITSPPVWQKSDQASADNGPAPGSLVELMVQPQWRWHALLGLLLATVGIGTFWSVTMAGQDLTKALLLRDIPSPDEAQINQAQQQAQFAYSIVETTGGGLGLLAFGPLAAIWGRRLTFLFFQFAAVCIVPIVCYVPSTYTAMLCMLPVYGFFTLGMHAGFAIYFPELFPARLRATGSGFCFSGGRVGAALVMWISGSLKREVSLPLAVTLMSLLFIPGMLVVAFLPETKGKPLPE